MPFFETIRSMLRAFGVNRAISYGILARIWGLFSGPVTIFMISQRFSQAQQGYFYTFGSLLAMQIFLELGLTGVIATFSSHEFAKLSWGKKGNIVGDRVALGRLTDLIVKSCKWYGITAIILVVGLIPAGLYFFAQQHPENITFSWKLPWILTVTATALSLAVTPFIALIIGSGEVASVNKRELLGNFLSSLISWSIMFWDGGLFAQTGIAFINALVSWIYVMLTKPNLLTLAWRGVINRTSAIEKDIALSWKYEIWPLQWKTALSFFAGYFIFQLFNPVLFYFHGPVISGQMGMTLNIFNVMIATGTLWMSASSPEFGKLAAVREWQRLDELFFKIRYQSVVVISVVATTAWVLVFYVSSRYAIGQRFLPPSEVAFLFATSIIVVLNNSHAVYLRAHKKEPLLAITLVIGVIQGILTLYLGKIYSSNGIVLGFFLMMTCIAYPTIYLTWRHYRRVWHHE